MRSREAKTVGRAVEKLLACEVSEATDEVCSAGVLVARAYRDLHTARPVEEWHEDDGFALFWRLPVCEPPYVGSPNCDDWDDSYTHWTPLPEPVNG